MTGRFTRETKLTELRGELKFFYPILNMGRAYENLLEKVKNRKGQPKFPREEQRIAISLATNPTEEIVRTLRMDNRTVGFFITTLEECKLYRAADFILENVLGEFPVERPGVGPTHIPTGDTWVDPGNVLTPLPDLQIGKTLAIPYAALSQVTNDFSLEPFEICDGRPGYISGGGFADVYYARVGKNNLQLAIKRLRENSELSMKQFTAEVETLDGHEHPNLLPVLGYSSDGPLPCIVYQYAPMGSLRDRLACKNNTAALPWSVRVSIAKQTADVLLYLHTRKPDPLIHRDVSSANVLLDDRYAVMLGDFGQLKAGPRPDSGHTSLDVSQFIGTRVYQPAEAPYKTSTKLDVYAYGMAGCPVSMSAIIKELMVDQLSIWDVVLLELLTGLPAFDDNRQDEEKSLRFHVREQCGDGIQELLDVRAGPWPAVTAEDMHSVATEECLQHERAERAEMHQIIDRIHHWREKP